MDIYVEFGMTMDQLFDEYGYEELAMASVFEVECECGEVYALEPDGQCKCHECGKVVASPLISAGLI